MKRKIYKLLSGAKQGLFALALTAFSGTAYSQTYTLNYTGNVQTLNLGAGTHFIEMWGGDGYTQPGGLNGKGGYSSGILTLTSAQTIYIYVGGVGGYQSAGVSANAWTFNGGGTGYPGLANTGYGNGGGASDIRTVGGTWDNATSLASRAIVAGGGGAGAFTTYLGGHGGGLTGGTGTYFSPDQAGGPTGGSQTAGGSNTGYASGITPATIGKASTWNGSALTDNYLAGGGGGYYGGASGRVSGGGGSSYIGGVTSGTTIMFGQPGFVTKPPVTVTGNGIVIINSLCDVNVSSTASLICAGTTVTLTTSAVSNYSWSTGNTTSPTIAVTPATTTSYTVSGVGSTPAGCTSTVAITITVNNTPTVNIAASSPTACLGAAVTLTASGANSYLWTGGPTTAIRSVTPPATTGYTVTGTNACGTATAGITITVSALPVTASATSTLICAGTPATLTAGGATTYTWMPGSNTQTNYIVLPSATTLYTVTGSTGPCMGTATINITTKPNPTITIAATGSAVCQGAAATLTASGASTYVWNPGGATTPVITVNPVLPTLYTAVGTGANGCLSSASQVMLVNPLPVMTATASDDLVCVNGPSTLTASGANTYAWSSSAATFTTVVNPASNTTYTVTGTSTANCSSSTVITVSVFDPTLSVSSSTAICKGFNTNLTASGMDGYVWSNNSLTFPIITVTPAVTTIYTVTGTSTSGTVSCSNSGTVMVTVNPNPTITAMATPPNICKNESAVLTASGAVTYTWVAITTTVAPSVTVSPATTQNYTVTGTDVNGCMGANKTTISLPVSECVGLSDNTAQAPGFVIYPNPNNGQFTIRADEAIDLQIVNELGQQVKTISLNKANDNEVNVTGLANGIYFISGQNQNGTVKQKIVITK